MSIEFHCPQCKRLMRTPDGSAGKKGKCPHCGVVTEIPRPAPPPESAKPAPQAARKATATATSDKVEFPCSQCGKLMRAAKSQAGKKGKCPTCGGIFQIPGAPSPKRVELQAEKRAVKPRSTGTGKRPTRAASAPASLDLMADLAPIGASGLTPLDDPTALTPLDNLADSGLVPLDDASGLMPLADDPLAGLSALDSPFAAAPVNPYQAPVAVPRTPIRKRRSSEFGYVEVLSCAWYTFWDNWTTCLLAPLLLIVVNVMAGVALGVMLFLFQQAARFVHGLENPPIALLYALVLILLVFFFLVGVFLVLFVQSAMAYISAAMVRGKTVAATDVFQGARFVLPLLCAAIIQALIGFALGLVLGLPMGVIIWLTQSPVFVGISYLLSMCINLLVTILLMNTQFLIVDQEQGVFAAISESVNSMKDKIPVTIALLLTVSAALVVFVVITLGLGILLAFPFFWVFLAAIYAKATGQRTAF